MIAAFRSGMGSLVDQWFGRSRDHTGPQRNKDRQGSRAISLPSAFADGSPRMSAHADIALRRFMAHSLDSSLADLRNDATPAEMATLEPAARVLSDLDLQAKYLPRRPSLLPQLMTAINSDTSMRTMARIIGQDGTLLGGLLQLANSSFYRVSGAKPIESLE